MKCFICNVSFIDMLLLKKSFFVIIRVLLFFLYVMSGKGRMAYNKALIKEKLRKWGRLSRKGDKIKFVDDRFQR